MELLTPTDGEDFIVRLAFKRNMPRLYPLVLGTPNPRRKLPLVDGEMLDELIWTAFNCDDTDDTFRGHLRQAVAAVKDDDVLTSLCAWRMGDEADTSQTADLTLLATVLPDSTSRAEAIQMIEKIQEALKGYDERLGSLAIEIAELLIELADTDMASGDIAAPGKAVKAISYQMSPPAGASIGPEGDMDTVGTLGPVFRICENGGPARFFGMTCSHVLSSSKQPVIPARDTGSGEQAVVACPADRDNFHWWKAAKRMVKSASENPSRSREADNGLRLLLSSNRVLGSTFALSGISSSPQGHWIRDWALVKFDASRFSSFDQLSNVPPQETRNVFENPDTIHLSDKQWEDTDWKRPGGERYVGRTTGFTAGRTIHRINPCLTVHHHLVGPDGKKKEHVVPVVKGKALVVAADKHDGVFAKRGDSGALVLNGHAQGVGTVFAMGGDATYVSPIGPNLDHMREVIVGRRVESVDIEYL